MIVPKPSVAQTSFQDKLLDTHIWTDGITDRQAFRQTDRQTYRQTDRKAGRQTDRQTDRQIDIDR